MRKLEELAVVAVHQIGIAREVGLNWGVEPRTANTVRLSHSPNIIDGANPKRGPLILATNDVWIIGWRRGAKAAHHEEAAVGTKIDDAAVMGGDGANLGEATGIFRREFEEGPTGMEKVAFGRDFATGAGFTERSARTRHWVSTWETPASIAFIDEQDRSFFFDKNVDGDSGFRALELESGGILDRAKLELGIQFVESELLGVLLRGFGCDEVEGPFVFAASAKDPAGHGLMGFLLNIR